MELVLGRTTPTPPPFTAVNSAAGAGPNTLSVWRGSYASVISDYQNINKTVHGNLN